MTHFPILIVQTGVVAGWLTLLGSTYAGLSLFFRCVSSDYMVVAKYKEQLEAGSGGDSWWPHDF